MKSRLSLKNVYALTVIALLGLLIIGGLVYQEGATERVGRTYLEETMENTIISNGTFIVYSMYRFYDTILELFIFATAVLGISVFSDLETSASSSPNNLIESHVVNASASFLYPIIALFGIFLAYSAYQGPGGGFAGGVISGTGVLLLAVASGAEEIGKRFYEKRMKKVEFLILLAMILAAVFSFFFPTEAYEGLTGLAFITAINISIGAKVFIGTWTILHFFVKHRGVV